MKYDFETINPRFNHGSAKWNELSSYGLGPDSGIVPFSVADMEFRTAPEIVEGLKEFLDTTILGYANATYEFLKAVCAWHEKRHSYHVEPEWILPSHGVVDAFFEAVKTFTEEGDGVLLLTPVYYPMYYAISRNNRCLVDCPLVRNGSRYDIDFDDFEKKAADKNTKLFILCSPHNPVSRIWTREELEKIAQICLRHNVIVISDEIHNDLVMPGYQHIVYQSISDEAASRSVLLTAPSKTFNLAGLQTSSVIIPDPEMRKKFSEHQLMSASNPKCNILGYEACRLAYTKCAKWLDEAISVINRNYLLVKDFMNQNFPAIRITELEATYLLWMDWNGLGLDYKELERINKEEARLFFDEGHVFGAAGEGFERWNLACPTKVVEEALQRMKETYSRYV